MPACSNRVVALLLAASAAALALPKGPALAQTGTGTGMACASSTAVQPLPMPPEGQAASPLPEPAAAVPHTYAHRLRATAAGWPVRDHWCIWIEPPSAEPGTAAATRERQWLEAVQGALAQWGSQLALALVDHPDQAQVRLWRRRPPLQRLADGRTRASHGRAVLQLLQVQRQGRWHVEPRVDVLLSPGQAPRPTQATALHELGHAFGLWGHSDQASDAMAAVPGAQAVIILSPRDRATLQWLLRQGPRLPSAPTPAGIPPAAPAPPSAPRAD